MQLAIYGRPTRKTDLRQVFAFLQELRQREIPYSLLADFAQALSREPTFGQDAAKLLQPTFSTAEEIREMDFLVSVGGDGTLLQAVQFQRELQLPLVGVNAGRLGFLTGVSQDRLPELLQHLEQGSWQQDRRTMLTVESAPAGVFDQFPHALNDVTIHKSNSNEMIVTHAYLNGQYLNSYWSDGLIVATPTGSTAYSLSCGGPIIQPQSSIFGLTPIAPHALTVRPITVPDTSVLTIEVESRSGQALVAMDNRTELVPNHVQLAIRRSPLNTSIVALPHSSFFETLRKRLNWGLDNRN